MHILTQLIDFELDVFSPVRPNPAEPARPSESSRTQIGDGRIRTAELRFGTAVRIRPNSDWGRPPESGRRINKT